MMDILTARIREERGTSRLNTIRRMIRPAVLAVASLAVMAAGLFPGCAEGEARESNTAGIVPELKERVAGLEGTDYAIVRRKSDELRAVLAAEPNNVKALVGLAGVFMYEARVTGDHPYYYPAAERLLDRALLLEPGNYEAVVSKASVLLSLHRFAEALAVAEQGVKIAPDAAAAYGALCDASLELGRYDAAVAAADRMMAIRPDLKSYSRVSYLREIHGDVAGAIEAMQLAVGAGAPGSEERAWARTTLGRLYLENGDVEQAREEFTMTTLERDPYPFALAGLADVLAREGKADSALALLDRALALAPEFPFVERKAEIYRERANDRIADSLVEALTAMLLEDEKSGHAMDRELAIIYANHGVRQNEAVKRARAELARRPDNVDALDAMAWVLYRSGNATEAHSYSGRALRLKSRSASMLARAALIEAAAGDRAKAEGLLDEALAINNHLHFPLNGEVRRVFKR